MDSMPAKELGDRKFKGITIAKPYGELLGEIALHAIGFIWGKEWSGKSTLALGMANAFAEYGRVDFVAAEESFSVTMTKKITQLKAYNPNLHVTRYKGLNKLKTHIKNVGTEIVFIDSVSVLGANDKEVVEFAQWCRDNKVGMWMVSHANKDGTYKGHSSLGHEPDIKIEVMPDDNIAFIRKNRYDDSPRSIPVPFGPVKSKKKKSKSSAKKKPEKKKKAEKDSKFDAQMNEVEQMLKTA